MIIQDHDSFIEIVFHEAMPKDYEGDFSISVTANCDSFTGSENGVWIERVAFNRFMEELKTLVKARIGSAKLESISPYKFNLHIYAKTPEDIRAEGELCKRITKGEDELASSRVVYEVRIDPKHLPRILIDFNFLLPKKTVIK